MILFDKDSIEADFKAFPGATDPRLIACLLQLSVMHNDLNFILTSGKRTPEHNKDIKGIADSGHCTKPLTAFDLDIRNKATGEHIGMEERRKIKEFLQFWWEDLFDWVLYEPPDHHVHLEVDKPFRKTVI